jgi:hypothetical protein
MAEKWMAYQYSPCFLGKPNNKSNDKYTYLGSLGTKTTLRMVYAVILFLRQHDYKKDYVYIFLGSLGRKTTKIILNVVTLAPWVVHLSCYIFSKRPRLVQSLLQSLAFSPMSERSCKWTLSVLDMFFGSCTFHTLIKGPIL